MNWYKIAIDISNLSDRNLVNARIHNLEKLAKMLEYASRLVHQTQRRARELVQNIMSDKRLSSFPNIKDILSSADKIALDSPNKFEDLCKSAVDEISVRIGDLKEERRKFTHCDDSKKGWIEE